LGKGKAIGKGKKRPLTHIACHGAVQAREYDITVFKELWLAGVD